MSKYTDTEKFYAEAVKWESQALTVLASLDPNVDYTEYAKWSVILNERTAFKHDIMDVEKADVEEVRHGRWIQNPYHDYFFSCSICGRTVEARTLDSKEVSKPYPYCHCGAKMDLTEVK